VILVLMLVLVVTLFRETAGLIRADFLSAHGNTGAQLMCEIALQLA
jgi:hypothetical protein